MKKSKNIEKPLFIKYAQQKSRKAAPRLCLRGFYAMIAPGIPPTAGRNTEQDKGTEAMTTLRKNDLIDIDITGMTAQGAGVGHWEGMAVFTPLTAPGDRARVRVVKVAKSYAFGRLEELLSPSPDRVEPDCPCFAQCGGCCYRHIRYEAELNIKEARVRDALERIGGFSGLPMRPILGAPSRNGYRNKALLPLGVKKDGSLSMGFYAVNSHRIVDCQRCLLQPEEFNRAMEAFRQWAAAYGDPVYDEGSHSGKMRRLYLRKAFATGEVMACVVANGSSLPFEAELVEALRAAVPGLASVVLNVNRDKTNVALGKECRTLWGADAIQDHLCGLAFVITHHPAANSAVALLGGKVFRRVEGDVKGIPIGVYFWGIYMDPAFIDAARPGLFQKLRSGSTAAGAGFGNFCFFKGDRKTAGKAGVDFFHSESLLLLFHIVFRFQLIPSAGRGAFPEVKIISTGIFHHCMNFPTLFAVVQGLGQRRFALIQNQLAAVVDHLLNGFFQGNFHVNFYYTAHLFNITRRPMWKHAHMARGQSFIVVL